MRGAPTSGPSRDPSNALRVGTAACGESGEHGKGDEGCQPHRGGQAQPVGEHPADQRSGEEAEHVVGQGEHAERAGLDPGGGQASHQGAGVRSARPRGAGRRWCPAAAGRTAWNRVASAAPSPAGTWRGLEASRDRAGVRSVRKACQDRRESRFVEVAGRETDRTGGCADAYARGCDLYKGVTTNSQSGGSAGPPATTRTCDSAVSDRPLPLGGGAGAVSGPGAGQAVLRRCPGSCVGAARASFARRPAVPPA
jgi:hypothetical protein